MCTSNGIQKPIMQKLLSISKMKVNIHIFSHWLDSLKKITINRIWLVNLYKYKAAQCNADIYIILFVYVEHEEIHIAYMCAGTCVSGQACCVTHSHYESLQLRVVTKLVHTTGKTWYKL